MHKNIITNLTQTKKTTKMKGIFAKLQAKQKIKFKIDMQITRKAVRRSIEKHVYFNVAPLKLDNKITIIIQSAELLHHRSNEYRNAQPLPGSGRQGSKNAGCLCWGRSTEAANA